MKVNLANIYRNPYFISGKKYKQCIYFYNSQMIMSTNSEYIPIGNSIPNIKTKPSCPEINENKINRKTQFGNQIR